MKNRNKIEQVPKVITTRLRTVKIKVVKIVLPNKLLLELRSPLSGVRGARYHIIKRSVAYLHIRESVVCSHSLLYSVLSCMSINVML
jgi:hypothetical protein